MRTIVYLRERENCLLAVHSSCSLLFDVRNGPPSDLEI